MRKLKIDELGRKNSEEYRKIQKLPLVVVLDNIRSMHNVGAVFRTSDAFLVEEVVLCGITACPPHRQIEKVALGATQSVAWRYAERTPDVLEDLRERGFQVIAVEQTAESRALNRVAFDKNKPTALVFGNEVDGVGDEALQKCDFAIEIPQEGTKHSLNVGVSVGIMVWSFFSA